MLSWPSRSSAERPSPGYRLVVLDLDSLLQPSGALHSSDVGAIRTAHALGVKVALVTAGPPQAIQRFWAQLGLGTPAIVLNGALIFDFPTHQHIQGQPIKAELVRKVLEVVARVTPKALVGLEFGDTWAVSKLDSVAQWRIKQYGSWPSTVGNLKGVLDTPIYQVWASESPSQLERLEDALADVGLSLMRYTAPERLLMRSPAASRGWALAALASYLDVMPHEVMAVGDGGLDRSLLQAAAFGVVVSDLQQEVAGGPELQVARTAGLTEAFNRYLNLENLGNLDLGEETPWPSAER